MRIALASDHAGFALKGELIAYLQEEGHEVVDCGPFALDPQDDYPDYCIPLAKKVASDEEMFGIVIGFSGQGEAMAANRVKGARAAVYYGGPEEVLRLSREHNNANILSLGAKFLTLNDAKDAVAVWLATEFSKGERHIRRIAKLESV
jgi:ribose 5-phosphate isomerase B